MGELVGGFMGVVQRAMWVGLQYLWGILNLNIHSKTNQNFVEANFYDARLNSFYLALRVIMARWQRKFTCSRKRISRKLLV